MGFFEAPPPPPEPEPFTQPSWIGPPDNVLGAPFPLTVVLARTPSVAIQLQHGIAYPTGFEFSLHLLKREHERHLGHGGPIHQWIMRRGGGQALAPEVLRFGIELADGRKATVFDQRPHPVEERDTPEGPILVQRGGGGGDRRYDVRFWVWPLPPEGPFAFVAEWPAEGIELTRAEIDSALIREAAAQAVELWPGGRLSAGAGSIVTSHMFPRRKPDDAADS